MVDRTAVVSGGIPLVVGTGIRVMDVDGPPLAGLVIIVALESPVGGDGELLAMGDVVAPGIEELEVLSVVEPVRILVAYIVSLVRNMGTRVVLEPFTRDTYCQQLHWRAGDKCPMIRPCGFVIP